MEVLFCFESTSIQHNELFCQVLEALCWLCNTLTRQQVLTTGEEASGHKDLTACPITAADASKLVITQAIFTG